jgi:D-glycero-D-manno-heptose 1,7-bisphosphate phosphatase
MSRRALFLDRDGVVNVDKGYISRREDFVFIDGIFELVALAKARGYLVIVVTNQAGIGRGYYTENDFHTLMDWVNNCFQMKNGVLDAIYFCPDHPVYGVGSYRRASPCRKPGPGMLIQAIADWSIAPHLSLLIGDNMTDMAAGQAAGIGVNILFRPPSEESYSPAIASLWQAEDYLLS